MDCVGLLKILLEKPPVVGFPLADTAGVDGACEVVGRVGADAAVLVPKILVGFVVASGSDVFAVAPNPVNDGFDVVSGSVVFPLEPTPVNVGFGVSAVNREALGLGVSALKIEALGFGVSAFSLVLAPNPKSDEFGFGVAAAPVVL